MKITAYYTSASVLPVMENLRAAITQNGWSLETIEIAPKGNARECMQQNDSDAILVALSDERLLEEFANPGAEDKAWQGTYKLGVLGEKVPKHAEELMASLDEIIREDCNGVELQLRMQKLKRQAKPYKESDFNALRKYEKIFHSALDAIFIHDMNGRFLEVNREVIRRLGYTRDELFHMHVSQINAYTNDKGVGKAIKRLQETGHMFVQTAHRTKSGKVIPTELNAKIIDYQGQKVVMSHARDVSEREVYKEQLRFDQEKFQSVFNSVNDAIFLHDSQGNIEEVNEAAVKLTGYSRKELRQMHPRQLAREDMGAQFMEFYNRLLQQGELMFELVFASRQGRHIPVEINAKIIEYQGENVVLAVARDITERKQAREALEESHNRYKMLFYDNYLPMLLIDPQTKHIVDANTSATNFYGYPYKELTRMHVSKINEYAPVFMDTPKMNFELKPREMETLHKLNNGQVRNVEVFGGPVNFSGTQYLYIIVHDITEKKQMAQELKFSEQRFSSFMKYLPANALMKKADGTILYANDTVKENFDLKGDAKTLQALDYLNEADAEKTRKHDMEVLEKGMVEKEMELRVNGDEKRMLQIRKFPVQLPSGETLIGGISLDVTARRQTEKKLKQEREQFLNLLDSIPENIYVADKETFEIEFANKAIRDMFAFDVRGQKCYELLYDEKEQCGFCPNKNVFENSHNAYRWEFYNKKLNKHFYLIDKAITWYDGRWKKFQMAIDITDRKNMELQLSQTLDALSFETWMNRALADLSQEILEPDLSVEKLSKRIQDVAMEIAESNFAYVGSISPETESLTLHAFSDKAKADCQIPGSCFSFAKEDGRYTGLWGVSLNTMEGFITNDPENHPAFKGLPEGHIPIKRFLTVPAIADNEPMGEIAVANASRDYTQDDKNNLQRLANLYAIAIKNIRYEDRLVEARKEAERANNAKSEFIANMSHEIRTPMNSIQGFTDLLLTQAVDKQERNWMEAIKSSSKTLLNLINDILDLSKIEAGRMDISPEPLELHSVLNEIKHTFSLKAAQKGLGFTVEVPQDMPVIEIDELRIRQILLNIAGNSIKFTEEGSIKLAVETEQAEGEQINLSLVVEDTGVGISEEAQKRIFEAFSQQNADDSRKYGGTGLGLAITKRLVEMMNGEIFLQSQPGKGTRFEIKFYSLTVAEAAELSASEELDIGQYQFFNPVVLVVDDVENNRKLIRDYLVRANINTYEAEDGQQAVVLAEQLKPDLIFMDLRMPGMDGYKATKLIKEMEATSQVPVIVISASSAYPDEDTKHVHFDGFLQKPVDMKAVFQELIKYLPYKTEEQEESRQQSGQVGMALDVSKEDAEAVAKALPEFKGPFYKHWEKLVNSPDLEEYSRFAEGLQEHAQQHDLHAVVRYAEQIKGYADNIDIENLEQIIKEYPRLIEHLENL